MWRAQARGARVCGGSLTSKYFGLRVTPVVRLDVWRLVADMRGELDLGCALHAVDLRTILRPLGLWDLRASSGQSPSRVRLCYAAQAWPRRGAGGRCPGRERRGRRAVCASGLPPRGTRWVEFPLHQPTHPGGALAEGRSLRALAALALLPARRGRACMHTNQVLHSTAIARMVISIWRGAMAGRNALPCRCVVVATRYRRTRGAGTLRLPRTRERRAPELEGARRFFVGHHAAAAAQRCLARGRHIALRVSPELREELPFKDYLANTEAGTPQPSRRTLPHTRTSQASSLWARDCTQRASAEMEGARNRPCRLGHRRNRGARCMMLRRRRW